MTIPRLDDPSTRIYTWELNENSTRYDATRAWPTSDALHIKFSVLSTITAISAVASLLLIVSILRKAEIRQKPFNLYILFIAIPDFVANFCCFLTCVMSAPKAEYYSEAMCGFQSFYLVFAFSANGWLNGVIMYQVHKLLRYSQYRRRYFPPTRKQVYIHTAAVYTFSSLWGMLAAFNIPGLPLESHAYYGFACFPMESDESLTWFFYFVFCPLIILIPCAYAFSVMIHIYWYKLLPSEGKRRKIAIFLVRIIALYFFVWFPFLLVGYIGNFVTVSSWVNFVTSVISHLQALFTTIVCYYTNNDFKASMREMMLCDQFSQDPQDGDPPARFLSSTNLTNPSENDPNGSSLSKRSDHQDDVPVSRADPLPTMLESSEEHRKSTSEEHPKRVSIDMETGMEDSGRSSYNVAAVSDLNGIIEDVPPSGHYEEDSENDCSSDY